MKHTDLKERNQNDKNIKKEERKRMMVVDPLMVNRFDFVDKFVNRDNSFRRILLICSKIKKNFW